MWFAALALILATFAAYLNSGAVPFLFDDVPTIAENPAVGRLWPRGGDDPGGLTTSGRPLAAFTFALNHRLHGNAVLGYHVTNFAIHAAAGLFLFGFVRRTLLLRSMTNRYGGDSLIFALLVAACWLLHPLQTESVTYIVQRVESLAGLFYLATLYAFVRSTDATKPARWQALAVVACLLGMASKETVVSAPLVVLLFDRTFVSGTFRAACQRHRSFYVGLAATWIVLAGLVLETGGRGGTAGFGANVSAWNYALTQIDAVVRYLALSVWPHPLIFDYGLGTAQDVADVLPQAAVVISLLTLALVLLARRPIVGFLAASFFLLLAPSSSVVPVVTQTIAEHRMYLSLAPLIGLLVFGLARTIGRRALYPLAGLALMLLLSTAARNRDYRGELSLWADTAAKLPSNARAHNNLGEALFRAGKVDAALVSYQRALDLQPKYPETHYGMGVALVQLGRWAEAIPHYEAALRFQPNYPEAHNNLGNALVQAGRASAAIRSYGEAIKLRPAFAEAYNNLGNVLLQLGRAGEAVQHFEKAVELRPGYAEAYYNLGNARAAAGAMTEALAAYERALAAKPHYAEALINAGNALLALGRHAEAASRYERATVLAPKLADAQYNFGAALLEMERWAEALPRFEATLSISPNYLRAERALGFALAKLGRMTEAVPHYERYLRAVPDDSEARAELAALRRQ